jgi:Cof subfamily protein (haloacid dehalogenase superfamily)
MAMKVDYVVSSARPSWFKCSAVISDVDGTLVTQEKILTASTQAAVAKLHAKGIAFSIISSRPPRGLCTLFTPLGITMPVGGFNGGVVATRDLAVLTEHLLPAKVARCAIDVLDARGTQVWIFSGQDWLLRHLDGPYIGLEERTVGFGPKVVEDFGAVLNSAAKIVGVSTDFQLLARCERELRNVLDDQATIARSQPYYVDVTHPLANKGAALSEIAKLIAVPLTEVVAIGDGGNDVAMFERSGLSIAMGNASPEVQRAADFVTESNSEDGFAAAIERFILGTNLSDEPLGSARTGDRP